MTKKCKFKEEATPFSLWLREQEEIDSDLGYSTTDIDYMWHDYDNEDWLFLEEKRNNNDPDWSQRDNMETLHNSIESDNYHGFHLVAFENSTPDDGQMYLDYVEIDREDLIEFLRFEKNENWYETTMFDKNQSCYGDTDSNDSKTWKQMTVFYKNHGD